MKITNLNTDRDKKREGECVYVYLKSWDTKEKGRNDPNNNL